MARPLMRPPRLGDLAPRRVRGLLERIDADPLQRVDEALGAVATLREIGVDQRLDHVGHLVVAKRRAEDAPGHGRAVAGGAVRAAEGDLVPLLAVLVDAEHADVAAVMVAARVDAAADVDGDVADVVQLVEVLEALRDVRRDRDRARVGERAHVAAGAADHVGEEADVGRREAAGAGRQPERVQVGSRGPTAASGSAGASTRSSPALKRSARSAAASICRSVTSPGAWPARLSESVTVR